jgi:hypothetical protein
MLTLCLSSLTRLQKQVKRAFQIFAGMALYAVQIPRNSWHITRARVYGGSGTELAGRLADDTNFI